MNIVIVDDDRFVSGALKTILEVSEEITVDAVGEDGAEAVALYRRHRPDVLLMDIRMKEMSGLEAAEKILEEFPDAKILLLTTFSDDDYIVRALRLGAKGYLFKTGLCQYSSGPSGRRFGADSFRPGSRFKAS